MNTVRTSFIVLLLATATRVSAQQHPTAAEHQDQPPVQTSTTTTVNNCQQPSGDGGEAQDGPPWWHKLYSWPEGITTWAVIGTLAVVGRQAKLMADHAGHLENLAKSADANATAALLSAQAVINAERAWLVVVIEKNNDTSTGALPTFVFTCLNQGKTPAQIKQIDAGYSIVGNPCDLPVPMKEEDVTPRNLPGRTFIVHRDSFTIRPEISPDSVLFDHRKGVTQAPKEFLMFFGRIRYHDVFQSLGDGLEAHETRWCYWYNETSGTLIPRGPDEYNNHT